MKAFFGFPVPDADRRVAEKRRKRKKSVFGSTFNFLGGRRKLHFRRKSPKREKKKKCKGSKNEKNIGALFWRKNGFRSNSMIWLHRATVEQPWASFSGVLYSILNFFEFEELKNIWRLRILDSIMYRWTRLNFLWVAGFYSKYSTPETQIQRYSNLENSTRYF